MLTGLSPPIRVMAQNNVNYKKEFLMHCWTHEFSAHCAVTPTSMHTNRNKNATSLSG